MAAALEPYLRDKVKVDLFVLVSDEGENELKDGEHFAAMFRKYRETVNAQCKLFLVSFLKVGEKGLIMTRLEEEGMADTKQFRLHPENPDTSKFNALLGMIALSLQSLKGGFYAVQSVMMHGYGVEAELAQRVANVICSFL